MLTDVRDICIKAQKLKFLCAFDITECPFCRVPERCSSIAQEAARAVAAPEISAAPEHYKMDTQQSVTSAITGTATPHYNSYNKANEVHQFLKFIFGIELCMFRTVSLSIIRSLVLYTQQQVYVIQVMLTAC
jgi:hypothetical protein